MPKKKSKKERTRKKRSSEKKTEEKKEDEEELIPLSKDTKRNIKRIVIIGAVILIIILALSFILGLQIKFVTQEQMELYVSPLEKHYDIHNDESAKVIFNISIDHPKVCKSRCTYTLTDISENTTLSEESSYDEYNKSFSYMLPVDRLGEGQKVFSYKVVCNNIRSAICNTNEKKYFKTAFITVNYVLSEEDRMQKEELEEDLARYLKDINRTYNLLLKDVESLDGIEQEASEKKVLLKDIGLLKSEIEKLDKERYITIWNRSDFDTLKSTFSREKLGSIMKRTEKLHSSTSSLADDYKEALGILKELSNDKDIEKAYRLSDKEEKNSIRHYRRELSTTINTIEQRRVLSIDGLHKKASSLKEIRESIVSRIGDKENTLVEEGKKILDSYALFIGSIGDVEKPEDICPAIENASQEAKRINEKRQTIISSELSEVKDTKAFANLMNESFKKILEGEKPEINESLYENITGTDGLSYNLTEIEIENTLLIDNEMISGSFYERYCMKDSFSLDIDNNITFPDKDFSEVDLDTTVPEIRPICCINEECRVCCDERTKGCEDNYPVLFVHGHAITENNMVERSHESFAKIQERMEDDGYVNTGQLAIDKIESIPKGEWGRFDAPISIRVSYYVQTYYDIGQYNIVTQKTDKIENYAIRLKELIDIIKERTAKDKVDIIAHSMGGLVSREYIAIFGDESVNKLIMLGTPNKGIRGRIKRLCSVLGSSRECKDMYYDSIFIKSINQETISIPSYTIRAIGCDMDGEDGDGIVLAKDVPLEYSTNYEIKGECTDILESNLHTNFINPQLYPETYNTIMMILKS